MEKKTETTIMENQMEKKMETTIMENQMEKKMETTIMENQMEKNMENEMETGILYGIIGIRVLGGFRGVKTGGLEIRG